MEEEDAELVVIRRLIAEGRRWLDEEPSSRVRHRIVGRPSFTRLRVPVSIVTVGVRRRRGACG